MNLLTLFLTAVWLLTSGLYTAPNVALGLAIALGAARLAGAPRRAPGRLPRWTAVPARLWHAGELALFFILELVIACLRVAKAVLRPGLRLRPAIVAVPLSVHSDAQLSLLSALITLTPGTLALERSAARRTLYVHGFDVPDIPAFRAEIKGLERRVLKVLP